jgi:putative phage-type endonuclease
VNSLNQQQRPSRSRPFGIGGSDISAILGLSPFKSALEFWCELTSCQQQPERDLLHLRFGQHAESFIAQEYERQTGLLTVAHPKTIFHQTHGYMYGHVDRFVVGTPDTPAVVDGRITANKVLECKTASAFSRSDWGESGTDHVPASYLIQCAWYMAITNCDSVDLAALIGNNEFRVFHIKRDFQLEGLITLHAQNFWMDHVLSQTPPEPTSSKDAYFLFPKETPEEGVEATNLVLTHLAQYRKLSERSERLSDECERVKSEILKFMASAERLTYKGKVLATWKSTKSSQRLDSKAMAAAHPDIAKDFTSTVLGSRRFLVKDNQTIEQLAHNLSDEFGSVASNDLMIKSVGASIHLQNTDDLETPQQEKEKSMGSSAS